MGAPILLAFRGCSYAGPFHWPYIRMGTESSNHFRGAGEPIARQSIEKTWLCQLGALQKSSILSFRVTPGRINNTLLKARLPRLSLFLVNLHTYGCPLNRRPLRQLKLIDTEDRLRVADRGSGRPCAGERGLRRASSRRKRHRRIRATSMQGQGAHSRHADAPFYCYTCCIGKKKSAPQQC